MGTFKYEVGIRWYEVVSTTFVKCDYGIMIYTHIHKYPQYLNKILARSICYGARKVGTLIPVP